MKPLLLLVSLLSFHSPVNYSYYLPVYLSSLPFANLSQTLYHQPSQLNSINSINLKNINKKVMMKASLLSQENKLSPLGVPPEPNRDIGIATVFLTLENHQQKNQTVMIEKIEIRNIGDRKLQPFAFKRRKIELKPLENAVVDIRLTNKTGYVGNDQVKAVITYKIENQVNVIESKPVVVQKS